MYNQNAIEVTNSTQAINQINIPLDHQTSSCKKNLEIIIFPSTDKYTDKTLLFNIKTVQSTVSVVKNIMCNAITHICNNYDISSDLLFTTYSDHMTNNSVEINVVDIIGNEFCVATEDASKLYDEIFHNIANKTKVIVSFNNVTFLTPVFLNMSICQLYGSFGEDIIDDYLETTNMNEEDEKLLSILKRKAKRYFENPKHYKNLIHKYSGGSNE